MCTNIQGLAFSGPVLYSTLIAVMTTGKPRSNQRFTVKEAAKRLNISEAAIRQRVQREQIAYEKDEETNRVYILLGDDDRGVDDGLDSGEPSVEHQLISTLQEQLRLEREASSELRRIIAGLTQRIPAVEAPSESQESPVTPSEPRSGTQAPPEQQEPERRSWWQRMFGTGYLGG